MKSNGNKKSNQDKKQIRYPKEEIISPLEGNPEKHNKTKKKEKSRKNKDKKYLNKKKIFKKEMERIFKRNTYSKR